jgi:type IV secretory pathway VirB6-like protein
MNPGQIFTNAYNQMLAFLSSKAGVLVSDGQDLAGVLLLVVVSWSVLMWLLTGDGPQALVESIGAFTRYAIVAVLLTGWLATVGGFFMANVNDISQKIAGVNSITTATDAMFNAAIKLFVSERAAEASNQCVEIDITDPLTGAAVGQGWQCPDGVTPKGKEPTVFDILVNLPMVLMTMFLKGLALIFMVLLISAFLLAIFMSEVLFGLAMAVGPIMVPWLIWQRTEWLFDGWLKFMLGACFTKIVAFFMVGATAGLVAATRAVADAVNVTNASDYLAVEEINAFIVCVTASIGAFMMWQVPSIAGQLVGGTGASTTNFGKGLVGSMFRPKPKTTPTPKQKP